MEQIFLLLLNLHIHCFIERGLESLIFPKRQLFARSKPTDWSLKSIQISKGSHQMNLRIQQKLDMHALHFSFREISGRMLFMLSPAESILFKWGHLPYSRGIVWFNVSIVLCIKSINKTIILPSNLNEIGFCKLNFDVKLFGYCICFSFDR